ncbi:BZ3500_MvSof-1268-A1-R1_Chr9g10354 [Microbotryum saponariae]|uniref:BZ3500_MvSof-1268-A1-R1_Chr9g10354 protein n=1 Tax=Microbotryum saponariae TaxID=289078 RepID=A0A2X0N410_9BASI|nr:BZ3501_MvSof-1269-A2-R1_Chr9g10104 [Microbotryum saponariae]SCZ99956.1 BZ3500_MvSof-1268-A1-R1_Chr9g10354 [Microbotryum saponariae]
MSTMYLITGASRGLGQEFTRQILKADKSYKVIAAARNPSTATALNELAKEFDGRVHVLKADVTDVKSLEAAAKELEGSSFLENGGIDVLINNAGVIYGSWNSPTKSTVQDLRDNFETNVFGVVQATEAFLPLLRKGNKKQIFVVSSLLGSIGGDLSKVPVAATYSASKAAINMWTVKLARELADEGFTVVSFHPGYVNTDMNGGENGSGEISTPFAIEHILKNIVFKVTKADNAKFLNYAKGEEIPW